MDNEDIMYFRLAAVVPNIQVRIRSSGDCSYHKYGTLSRLMAEMLPENVWPIKRFW